LANPTTDYVVRDAPVQLAAKGLVGDETIPIEIAVQGVPYGQTNLTTYWAPLLRAGKPVALTAIGNQLLEILPGNYRLDATGPFAGGVVVSFFEDESANFLSRPAYVMGAGLSGGCTPVAPLGVVTAWGD
jgi:hypothetical protein